MHAEEKNKSALFWFRNNLRLHDQFVLSQLHNEFDKLICIYIIDEKLISETSYGFSRAGKFRRKFLNESLKDLDISLRKLGQCLVLLKGNVVDQIEKLVHDFKIDNVFAQSEFGFEEQEQERQLLNILEGKVKFHSQSLLLNEGDLKELNSLPLIFTEFRKSVWKKLPREYHLNDVEILPRRVLESENIIDSVFTEVQNLTISKDIVLNFSGGENNAQDRLDHFISSNAIEHYKSTRNGMLLADDSSKLSPWLANGNLSVRFIWNKIVEYENSYGENDGSYWMKFELLWREFFKWTGLKFGRKIFLRDGINMNKYKNSSVNHDDFEKWRAGNTGVDFIDANMNELNETGWMSNRGRQNVASYLVNDLEADWRWGAAWFEHQLIDYDVENNWCNWMYIAGVGNDPRPDRYFNIEKQAGMYDPDYLYRKKWLPN